MVVTFGGLYFVMPFYSLPSVNSATWCMSVQQAGTVITDVDVYKQRVYCVLNTPLGGDPLRPTFGCDYFKYLDTSLVTAAANIKSEVIKAIKLWVPEVTLNSVVYTVSAGVIVFSIKMTIGKTSVVLPFSVGLNGFFGGVIGTKIINTGYKWYWNVMTPGLMVSTDGNTFVNASPAVPGTLPWTDIGGMVDWIRSNWSIYGKWGYGKDEIILYLDKAYKDAKLTLTFVS